ncbi:MAG: zinc-ribbon domain-containing protein [Sedimenticola sp.]
MDKLFCNHCGFERPDDESDCPNCGAPSPLSKGSVKKRFIFLFVILILFYAAAIFILPR